MYDRRLLKLTWGGTVAGSDVWTNQLHITPGDGEPLDQQTVFDAIDLSGTIKDLIRTAYTGTGGIARYETLDWVKLSMIDENGLLVGEPKYYDYPTPVAGTSTFNVPPQDSIVLTLTTNVARGLAYKGRIFLPAGFADVQGTDGRLTPAAVSSLVARFKTMFDGLQQYLALVPEGAVAVVASDVRQGATHNITGIQIGNLVDTQRRRRNRLDETYTGAQIEFV